VCRGRRLPGWAGPKVRSLVGGVAKIMTACIHITISTKPADRWYSSAQLSSAY
jgi:hypothetical protein